MNIFDTRKMTVALETLYEPKQFLSRSIFSTSETHDSQYVDIDIEKGGRSLAPYVNPLHEGKKIDRAGFTTKSYKAPYTKPKMVTKAENFLTRPVGKDMYSSEDRSTRAQKQLGKDLKEMGMRIDRLEESQAAEALQTGKVTVVGDGVNEVIDFGFDASHLPVLSGTSLWSDHTNADPVQNFSDWFDIITKDAGLIPSAAYLGRGAVQNMIRCAKFKDMLDTRRITLGQIDPQKLKENGIKYWGYLNEPGIDIYTYADNYRNAAGNVVPYINDGSVIMIGDGARLTRHYGAIEDLDSITATARFAKSWKTEDPSARWVMVQSAPLLVPHQVDGIVTGTVL